LEIAVDIFGQPYDVEKIEVTGGKGKLKSLGGGSSSGDTINPDFDADSSGWSYFDWGQGGGEVNVTGTRNSSGGNPNGWVDVNFPTGKNDELGGYWEQSFETTVDNPTIATTTLDWLVSQYDATPDTFKLYVFIDSTAGAPTVGTEVWSSGEISGTTSWASVSDIDISSSLGTLGTYYIKIATWVETGSSNVGPYEVGFDNVSVHWESSGSGTYSTDSPTISNTNSFTPATITSWTSFVETSTKNGGEIYYQLSDDDGVTWKYWNGSAWVAVSEVTDYNTASIVNTYISQFPTANKKLKFKAFLESDGSQLIELDNIEVGYNISDPTYYGNRFIVDSTSGAGLMGKADEWTSIRFDAKNSKSADSVRVYLHQEKGTSPTYRYGLQSDSGGSPSGTWLGGTSQAYGDYQATATGWHTITLNEPATLSAGTTYHLVVQYQSGTINSGRAIELRRTYPDNFLHAIDSSTHTNSNVLWSGNSGSTWTAQGYQPIYVLGFTDSTYEGNPYHEVVEHSIYGTSFYGEKFTMSANTTVSSVGGYISENNEGPEDNLYIDIYDVTNSTVVGSGSLAASANVTNNVFEWQTFNFTYPVALIAGNTYRIYFSSPDSLVTAHYLIRTIYHDNDTDLNGINYSGAGTFYTYSNNSGTSWVDTDIFSDISGFRFPITVYKSSGYVISSAFDTGSPSVFQVIEWDQTTPSCSPSCVTKLQIQTAPDSGGSPGTWSSTWSGPDGEDGDETDFYTVSTGELVHSDHNGDQWIRYKATLSGDNADTPVLLEIRVNYK